MATQEATLTLTERQQREAAFHDQWAESIDFTEIDPDITFESPTALECRYIMEQLGDITGKSILDLGCGSGESSVYFAKKGAVVTGTDISPGFIDVTKKLAAHHNVGVNAQVSAAEKLPFPDNTFDVVFANGVLHHVDISPTMAEIKRVLKPGGRGFFIEPLPYNPAINAYRIIAKEVRTPDERPLHRSDRKKIRAVFPETEIRGFWLFTLIVFLHFYFIEGANPNKERYWKKVLYEADRYKGLFGALKKIDDILLPAFPFLQGLCWNMVISVRK